MGEKERGQGGSKLFAFPSECWQLLSALSALVLVYCILDHRTSAYIRVCTHLSRASLVRHTQQRGCRSDRVSRTATTSSCTVPANLVSLPITSVCHFLVLLSAYYDRPAPYMAVIWPPACTHTHMSRQ